MFLTAGSQVTFKIRLGHGIIQLPSEVNHPARVAERASPINLFSIGMVGFADGESSSELELRGFGVDRENKQQQWEQQAQALQVCLSISYFLAFKMNAPQLEGQLIQLLPVFFF